MNIQRKSNTKPQTHLHNLSIAGSRSLFIHTTLAQTLPPPNLPNGRVHVMQYEHEKGEARYHEHVHEEAAIAGEQGHTHTHNSESPTCSCFAHSRLCIKAFLPFDDVDSGVEDRIPVLAIILRWQRCGRQWITTLPTQHHFIPPLLSTQHTFSHSFSHTHYVSIPHTTPTYPSHAYLILIVDVHRKAKRSGIETLTGPEVVHK